MATDRRSQPKCKECSHPRSFHGGGFTPCRALGCECEKWVRPDPQPEVEVEAQTA